MAIQFGTVDGLVNITKDSIFCFVKGIDEFVRQGGPAYAKLKEISFGTAFQRFVDPVYNDKVKPFSIESINQPVFTRSGAEQSPARVTFCKKMGLLKIDESNDLFELTSLGKLIAENNITIEEYSFILLSKMGIYKDGTYLGNLLSIVSQYFQSNATLSQSSLGDYVKQIYNDSSIVKTRLDIIINTLVVAGLITKVANDIYVLSGLGQAELLLDYYRRANAVCEAKIDTSDEYSDYIGSIKHGGIFDILSLDNITLYSKFYPNLIKFVNTSLTNKLGVGKSLLNLQSIFIPNYLTAIRTKPFLLLAGISGTGKSRIVRKLAQATDDIDVFVNDEDRWKKHKPANFELIQVKPNWHNSMDVVGFQSNIPEPHYEFTPFVDFVVKAWCHEDTSFFLCLDEMNLAPVEEYFAEFLSAIESRSIGEDGDFETDPIIKPFNSFGSKLSGDMMHHFVEMGYELPTEVEKRLREKGLTLPKNLIVMGTVNMDETTFSFSRKVLDRAMSIEMNKVNYDDFILGKTEYDLPNLTEQNSLLINRPISAQEVKESIASQEVMDFLKNINDILDGTPFKLGYRAANEAILYVAADKLLGSDNLMAALDDFVLMKILSRIEGDDSKLVTLQGEKLLDELYGLLSSDSIFGALESSKTLAKLQSMRETLKRDHFVSFWG